jgi:hypothetical protein
MAVCLLCCFLVVFGPVNAHALGLGLSFDVLSIGPLSLGFDLFSIGGGGAAAGAGAGILGLLGGALDGATPGAVGGKVQEVAAQAARDFVLNWDYVDLRDSGDYFRLKIPPIPPIPKIPVQNGAGFSGRSPFHGYRVS